MKGKTFIGKVISVRMQKTVIVAVAHTWRHPLYKKAMTRTKRYACHNENLSLVVGDTVRIEEVRPVSKTKHFRVVEKLS